MENERKKKILLYEKFYFIKVNENIYCDRIPFSGELFEKEAF